MVVTGGVFGANPFANPFDTGFDMTQSAFNPGQFVPFGDVYRQMTAEAPWTLNPLGRKAAAAMQPLLSTQYALQQPGVNMPESMLGQNPYRQFLQGNLYGMNPATPGGRFTSQLSGQNLQTRLQRIANLISPGAAAATNPLDMALQQTFADPQNQLAAAALPALQRSAPAIRSALQSGYQRLFDRFMGANPTGNFLRASLGMEGTPLPESFLANPALGMGSEIQSLNPTVLPTAVPTVEPDPTQTVESDPLESVIANVFGNPALEGSFLPEDVTITEELETANIPSPFLAAGEKDDPISLVDMWKESNVRDASGYIQTDRGDSTIDSLNVTEGTLTALSQIQKDLAGGLYSNKQGNLMVESIMNAQQPEMAEWIRIPGPATGKGYIRVEDLGRLQRGEIKEADLPALSEAEYNDILMKHGVTATGAPLGKAFQNQQTSPGVDFVRTKGGAVIKTDWLPDRLRAFK